MTTSPYMETPMTYKTGAYDMPNYSNMSTPQLYYIKNIFLIFLSQIIKLK